MPRLKVFRTPIGFHDAYVAAPSRKAALSAWGADANLFARGVAEEVTDPALMAEPLASPGQVVRKPRGTMAEHLAALPPTKRSAPRKAAPPAEAAPAAVRRAKPPPRPSRAELEAAETALGKAERERAVAMDDLAEREAALARQRRALERDHARALQRLEDARDAADRRYAAAMAAWRKE